MTKVCYLDYETCQNPQAFVPKSHVGLSSEGCLNSWWNSVPQRT
jgi:hypothetical protein